MQNPYIEAAKALKDQLRSNADQANAKRAAEEADRKAKAERFQRAAADYMKVENHLRDHLKHANNAFDATGIELSMDVEPLTDEHASTIKITMSHGGKELGHFRVVGNPTGKLFVHEVTDPKYGPFELEDVDAVPYAEILNQFIRQMTAKVASQAQSGKS